GPALRRQAVGTARLCARGSRLAQSLRRHELMQELTLLRPDDWHVHFRDGEALAQTVPATARVFRRAIVMPNLVPPVVNTAQALAYRERILAQAPAGSGFEPLLVL